MTLGKWPSLSGCQFSFCKTGKEILDEIIFKRPIVIPKGGYSMAFNCNGRGQEWLEWGHSPRHCKMIPVLTGLMGLNLSLRAFIISCLSTVRSLVRAGGWEWERRAQRGGAWMGPAFFRAMDLSLFLRRLTASLFQFLVNLCLSLFFCIFYLSTAQTSSCEYKQEMKAMKLKVAKWLFCLKKFWGPWPGSLVGKRVVLIYAKVVGLIPC